MGWSSVKFYHDLTALLVDDFARAAFRGENDDDTAPPEQIGYLWRWFSDLTDWRECSMGVGPLSHQEIESWARLMRVDISPFEVDVVRRLDREFRAWQSEKENPEPTPIGEQLRALAKNNKQG